MAKTLRQTSSERTVEIWKFKLDLKEFVKWDNWWKDEKGNSRLGFAAKESQRKTKVSLWWEDMRAIMLLSVFVIKAFDISYKDDCNNRIFSIKDSHKPFTVILIYLWYWTLYRSITLLFKTKWAISAFLGIVVLLQKFAHKNGFKFMSQKSYLWT